MNNNDIAIELFNQFKVLEANLSTLLALAPNEDEKNRLRASYAQAWRNYNLALNRVFDINDQRIKKLHTDLVAEGAQLNNALSDLTKIVNVINIIAQVITVGATIALA